LVVAVAQVMADPTAHAKAPTEPPMLATGSGLNA
jgi:hypothetical protein